MAGIEGSPERTGATPTDPAARAPRPTSSPEPTRVRRS